MYVVTDVDTNGLSELIDWVYYPSNHDELENHEEPRPTMHTLWIQLLWVLAMTCPNCLYWEEDEHRFCECEEE